MKYANAFLAITAGLASGVLAHYLLPPVSPPALPVPNVIAAEKFVLVDGVGAAVGTFATLPRNGAAAPAIVLYDALGREVWRATNSARPLTLAQSNSN